MQLTNPCPWCGGTEGTKHRSGLTGCNTCSAVIPVNAEWYKNGNYKPRSKGWL